MATPKKAPRTVTTAEWLPAEPAAADDYLDDLPIADEADATAALCPVCGDLLAWHEQLCLPASITSLAPELAEEAEEEAIVQHLPLATGFAYEVGHRVQPTPVITAEVIWRGQLKERHPATGLIHRVNVYRLNDGYWDCYREEELQVA
jgi:hypothetical protein